MPVQKSPVEYDNTWLHFFPSDQLGKTDGFPSSLVSAQGIYVTDSQGRQYMDAISGAYCVNVGYGRDSIIDAASQAAKKLAFCSPFSFSNPYATQLAQTLAKLAKPVVGANARVFFTNSGSEAVETALKIARAFAVKKGEGQRKWLVSRDHAYHGLTLGALSVCGFPSLKEEFGPLLPMTATIPSMRDSADPFNDLLKATPGHGNDIAGVLLESVETSNGMTTPSEQYLESLRRIRKETGALLILDEVITGFGRLGSWFGAEHYGLEADIIICAKGLTSGYDSLGATIVSERVASIFAQGDDSMFTHGATFGGRPAAAAAALENIGILEREQLLANAASMGAYLKVKLEDLFAHHPKVSGLTGVGLLQAIHLKSPDSSDPATAEQVTVIRDRLLQRGVITSLYYTRHDPTIEIAPPLCITQAQIDQLCLIIRDALK
ncbi:aspartate aminotransferase family protein [Pseudomonas gingeri]|uniref:Aspartate aminotransferase family protein n=1 Tax=Pseudomonas gingeri TaxID=117681 RepID=A0A7Y8C4T5_9PSED|nr:aminotransferase class III-fold pyridoxal phosphate-dependent enzyme [Pseudomonas gingeri]NWB99513.1 aspartate aminotransferase family protein [Pseudomonas gingeri]